MEPETLKWKIFSFSGCIETVFPKPKCLEGRIKIVSGVPHGDDDLDSSWLGFVWFVSALSGGTLGGVVKVELS